MSSAIRLASHARSLIILAASGLAVLNVTTVRAATVSHVFFSPPVNVTNNSDQTKAMHTQVAVDAMGNINTVWVSHYCVTAPQYTCEYSVLFSRSIDGGTTFSSPTTITAGPFDPDFGFPQLALEGSNHINVVWQEHRGILFSRSRDGGVSFSTPTVLSEYRRSPNSPKIAVDRAGNINVVWQEQPFVSPHLCCVVFARSVDGGNQFSAPKDLCDPMKFCRYPEMAVNAHGRIFVVWDQWLCQNCREGHEGVFLSRSDEGTLFEPPQNLSNSAGWPVTAFRLLVDPHADVNVMWTESASPDPTNDLTFVSLSRSTDHGITFTTRALSSIGDSMFPEMGVDDAGNENVFWLDLGEYAMEGFVLRRSLDRGVTFSAPKNIMPDPKPNAVGQQYLAVTGTGTMMLVWSDAHGIFVTLSYDGGATFSVAKEISDPTRETFVPAVTTDMSGNVLVWWRDLAGKGSDVVVSRGVSLESLRQDVAAVPVSAFKNASHRKVTLQKLDHVGHALAGGQVGRAISQLDDLLWHANGCGLSADPNDWITDCAAQLKIQSSIKTLITGLADEP